MLRTEHEPAVRVVSSRCVVRACVHAVSPVAFPHGFRMGGQHDATATGENSSTFTVITRRRDDDVVIVVVPRPVILFIRRRLVRRASRT